MKLVKHNETENTVQFVELKIGALFHHNDMLYMKAQGRGPDNAVCLYMLYDDDSSDGYMAEFQPDEYITPENNIGLIQY